MSSKYSKKKDEKISSVIEIKGKDNKLIYILLIIILILSSLLVYFVFFNRKEKKCDNYCSAKTIEVEVDPKYQLINYEGFRFKMPLDWDFVSDNNIYSIADKNEKIYISLDKVDIEYSSFVSSEYQHNFLEKLQTSDNIKIEGAKEESNHFVYDGSYNNYNFLIVAVGNEQKTILVKAQFIDKVSFNDLKDNVIKFAMSYEENI